jgi:hypothetical protein
MVIHKNLIALLGPHKMIPEKTMRDQAAKSAAVANSRLPRRPSLENPWPDRIARAGTRDLRQASRNDQSNKERKMKLNTLYTILAVIALGYGAVAVLLPGFLVQLLWPNPAGPEGYLLLQGWGSCLIAFSVIAWGARRMQSGEARRVVSMWLMDALSRGWTIFSVLTFGLLVLCALGFGYFGLVRVDADRPVLQSQSQ